MIKKQIFTYLVIITLFIIPTSSLFSQTLLDGGFLEMTMIPENPEPFQNVTLTLKSSTYDLDRLKITWSIDGVDKRTEIGLKNFSTVAGKGGQKTTVKAVIASDNELPPKGIEAFFIPSLVDLIYESSSYTPPFYKGKALNPGQGTVTITAIPELIKNDGTKIPTQNIIYRWKKDGEVIQSASGYGKNTFSFTGTLPVRDSTIEVNASSVAGDIYAAKSIKVKGSSPEIIFYEDNLLFGALFNRAIKDTVKMNSDEFSVLAVPYFFSVGYSNSPDLNYKWNIDGKTVENQSPKNSFTTRIEKAGTGSNKIGLEIANINRIFQNSNNGYYLNFEK